MLIGELVRELALGEMLLPDISHVCGSALKASTETASAHHIRIQHNDRDANGVTHISDCADKIRISGNQRRLLIVMVHCPRDQMRGEIDVGLFFFDSYNLKQIWSVPPNCLRQASYVSRI